MIGVSCQAEVRAQALERAHKQGLQGGGQVRGWLSRPDFELAFLQVLVRREVRNRHKRKDMWDVLLPTDDVGIVEVGQQAVFRVQSPQLGFQLCLILFAALGVAIGGQGVSLVDTLVRTYVSVGFVGQLESVSGGGVVGVP